MPALAWGAAGIELLRLDRYAEAAAALERALEGGAQTPGGIGPEDTALLSAEWAAARLTCLVELGRLEDARAWLPSAAASVAALPPLPAAPPGTVAARVAAVQASVELESARLHARAGQLDAARAAAEQALASVQGRTLPLLQARIEHQLGGLLAFAGEPQRALALWQAAEERLAASHLQGQVLLRARLAMNRGIASAELGRHEEATVALGASLPLFEGLVASGYVAARAELARALRNQGFLHGRAGRHAQAVPVLEQALAASRQALRRAASADDRRAWRYSRGGTFNSLGYSQLSIGQLAQARASLMHAAADLRQASAGPGASALHRDELARAWVNRAHLEAHEGRLGAARRLYLRAAAQFDGAKPATAATAGDRINARLGLARVAMRQQRMSESASLFGPALAELAALTRQGQLQHESAWLAAWLAQRDAWLAITAARNTATTRGARADAAAVAMLVAALATPPQHAAGLGPEPLHALADAAGVGSALTPPQAQPAAERVAVAYLRFLLAWMAELLADHDPNWIHTHQGAAEAAIEALRANASQREQAAPLLVQWFVATRGLRAQRSALAEGDEPEMDLFRDLLQRLHRIEQEILGERAPREPAAGATDLRQAIATATLGAPTSRADAARQQEWREARAQLRQVRTHLAERGLLPIELRLDDAALLERVAPGQALLLLARPRPDRLLLLLLMHEPVAPARRGASPGSSASRSTRAMLAARRRIDQVSIALDGELAPFPCATLHALARSAWADGAAGPGSPADHFALAMFARLWQCSVRPVLPQLLERGITAIDLVPSGDLHLVPWNHFADLEWAGSLRLFPSIGAWWRCRGEEDRAAHASTPTSGLHWALATPTGAPDRLRWVAVESRLSQRLWGEAMRPIGEVAEADALLGIGHGVPPDTNPARAGLLVGDGAGVTDGVLLPHHLLRLRRCRHALLSACLLGHVDGTPGEALGFISGCFDHRFVFAAGWLTEVGDHAACLYSLAAQWSLRQRAQPAPAQGGWSATLATTRRQLLRGAWPEGFATWLAKEWPREAPDVAAPVTPPAALRRALPWAVTLG